MKRVLAIVVSIRTSVVLMLLIAVMLLASVVVPQRSAVGGAVPTRTGAPHFLIDTLGLSDIAASPLFIGALVLFYLNLVAVLAQRLPSILGKVRLRKLTAEALEKWVASPRAVERACDNLEVAIIVKTLRGFGFRPQRVTNSSMYAVKHRYAAIGFLLFHVAFFFLCAGGLLIWYTRWSGELRVIEGQSADATSARVLRRRPPGGAPDLPFTLEKMTPSFEHGEATDLRATVRVSGGAPVDAWVNHPVERGAESILVTDIGIASVLWLQDARSFGVDRVAVPVGRNETVDVPLAAGIVKVMIQPPHGPGLPSREELQTLPLDLVISEGGREVFRGSLRPGDAAQFAGGRLVLSELRYWGGLRIVSERGGSLLIIGFVLIAAGATWRLLLHRRDLVIAWSGCSFRLAGHGEWFADRDRRELDDVANAIVRATGEREARAHASKGIEVNA